MRFSQIKEHLSHFTVGIAGSGGLGSNCAAALARTGIGHLVICDFDTLEIANLNRQYYFKDQVGMKKVEALKENLQRINPETRVTIHDIKLYPDKVIELFSDCEIIVEAFDLAEMKQMLAETVLSVWPDKPLIIGSGMAGWGNNQTIHERKIDDALYVCGDELSEVSDELPTLAPRVGIVANMQANIVVDLLIKKSAIK
ncbi:MAG TPA: sulfur carrier protein ThiS adenylyltransferase ThiF [Bacteroidales bacterium]|nr:sulfur carrier protein ThiS adenylyltransferase ThiF [Bacteroidales bacterium]